MSTILADAVDLSTGAPPTNEQDFPTPPKITDLQWRPPAATPPNDVGSTLRLMINMTSQEHEWFALVPDIPDATRPWPNLVSYQDWGGVPAGYMLTLRSYLRLVPNSYTQVPGPNTFSQAYETTYGISDTDSNTISAELGVTVEGLGAKISDTWSTTVTTSTTNSQTTTYNVNAPPNMTRVWMLWQVIDEIVAIGPDGNVIHPGTRSGTGNWIDEGIDMVLLWYTSVSQVFPSQFVIQSHADFPNS